ncbi:response regulator [Eggerthella guodeyinii]|uniref:Circadian input-output histidine kinase CikA n=2 Tax=Eggerthella guodeyinii TaxID=2690837 RepID=A0A6L7IVC4_9ACTN|nr:response regulator [Eggerthella guodeyinii]
MGSARYDRKRGVLPMELITRSRERRRIALVVVVLVLTLLIALVYTVVSSREATSAAVETMSEVYLQELSDQVIAHFNTGIDGKFCQIDTVGSSLSLYQPADLDEVRDFLACMEADDEEYAYLALRGNDGRYYTARGVAAASDDDAARGDLSLSYRDASGHDVMLYDGTIALVDAFDPVTCGDVTFTAVVAGYDVNIISGRLNLDLIKGSSRSSVIGFDGTCIAGCDAEGLCNGDNLFDALEATARLDDGFTMDQVREAVDEGDSFLLPFWYKDHHEYLYFRPMDNQDWYLCTAMPYGVVDEDIAGLSKVLMQNAVLMATMIVAVIVIFFLIYYRLVKRNTRLLSDEKDRAERASEEARRASLAKSEFLSRMSHEIRTPMNGIMGMTAIALEHAHDEEKTRACLEKIDVTSEHLMALINDILDMSKIESGKIDIKRETFDFAAFVGSLNAVFGTQALEQGIRYETEEAGALPSLLVGDGLRLNQIIYNLVGNAFKFTPCGGSVTLRIEELPARPDDDAGRGDDPVWLRFSVTDTGCGIEPENRERIFSSFEQGDDASRMRGGTGLGLAITKRFAEMMGGSIALASEVGKGSTFTVDIPFGRAAAGEGPAGRDGAFGLSRPLQADADDAYDFSGKQIVIAEDNELNREIATEVLVMTGAEVVAVSTGAEAVRVFERSRPGSVDLILMDIQMPEMDGYEATRVIRALDRDDARTVPIIAMTANAFVEDEERSRMSGMDGHLSKPLDIRLVYATIDGFLRERPRGGGA